MSRFRVSSVLCALGLICVWLAFSGPITPASEQWLTSAYALTRAARPQSTGTLSGTVSGPDGAPLEGFWVGTGDYETVAACEGGGAYGAWSGSGGAYRIDVPPGTYLVAVNSHNPPGSYLPEAYRDVNSWSAIGQATRVTVAA